MRKIAIIGIILTIVATSVYIVVRNRQEFSFEPNHFIFQRFEPDSAGWHIYDFETGDIQRLSLGEKHWVFPNSNSSGNGIVFVDEGDLAVFRAGDGFSGPLTVGNLAVLRNPVGNPHICSLEIRSSQPQILDNTALVITPHDTIEEIDYNQCKINTTLFSLSNYLNVFDVDTRSFMRIASAHISSSSHLAVSVEKYAMSETPYLGAILIIDLTDNSVVQVIERATHAIWSPDGSQLAYIGIDGLYITETSTFSVVHFIPINDVTIGELSSIWWRPWLPIPQWSDEGKKLLYHRHLDATYSDFNMNYGIYMFDLVTHNQSRIVENGVNPTWIRSRVPD